MVNVEDGYFAVAAAHPSGWFHSVLVYHGPNDCERITVYHDGTQVGNDTSKRSTNRVSGEGRILIGRRNIDTDWGYNSVEVDELVFWNRNISSTEVQLISN